MHRFRLRLPILVLLVWTTFPVRSQDRTYELPVREHLFPNGLRLLVLEQPGNPRVACKIFTDFGAMVETPGDLGAAHFLEHLMFKGTHTLGTRDWQAEQPIIEAIYRTEAALIEALNRARNDLRQRGVFHEYQHRTSTPEIDSLRKELQHLEAQLARYRVNGEMMRWYQAYGGTRLTASTEQEYMKFDINLPVERVALFLRIEADRMVNSVFREFDQERMILVEQRYGDLNRPTTPFYEAMNALVQTVHPVFWPEGYLTDFEQYTRHYQRDLYQRYFIPNNTTLVLVGGVRLEQMIPLVEHYFGWMPRRPEPMRVKAIEPKPAAEKRLVWRSRKLAPRVDVRYLIPAIGHPDRPHFDVLAEVLQDRLEARLQKTGPAVGVNVNTRVVHTSRFGVPATLNLEVVARSADDLQTLEQGIHRVVEALKEQPVSAAELDLAKKRLRLAWYRTALNPDALAFKIGHFQVMDHWTTLDKHLKTRERTTADDLQRLARTYFIAANRSVGVVRPPEEAHSGSGEEAQ